MKVIRKSVISTSQHCILSFESTYIKNRNVQIASHLFNWKEDSEISKSLKYSGRIPRRLSAIIFWNWPIYLLNLLFNFVRSYGKIYISIYGCQKPETSMIMERTLRVLQHQKIVNELFSNWPTNLHSSRIIYISN